MKRIHQRIYLGLIMILTLFLIGCSGANNSTSDSNSGAASGLLLSCNKSASTLLTVRADADPANSGYAYVTFLTDPSAFSSGSASIKLLVGTDTSALTTYAGFIVKSGALTISGYNPAGSLITESYLKTLNNGNALSISSVSFHVNVGPLTTVLRIVLENSGTVLLDKIDMLIPSFDANPNTYGSNHASALLNLHPLYSYRNQNWTSDKFQQQGQFLCQ